MARKEIHYPYYCKKCTRTVYFSKLDEINEICSCCKQQMEKWELLVTHGKQTLQNINKKGFCTTQATSSKPTVECPYCHSFNTKKISGTKRWFSTGIFGLSSGVIGKNFKCNNCKSNF